MVTHDPNILTSSFLMSVFVLPNSSIIKLPYFIPWFIVALPTEDVVILLLFVLFVLLFESFVALSPA
jgi:hypothetical protein